MTAFHRFNGINLLQSSMFIFRFSLFLRSAPI